MTDDSPRLQRYHDALAARAEARNAAMPGLLQPFEEQIHAKTINQAWYCLEPYEQQMIRHHPDPAPAPDFHSDRARAEQHLINHRGWLAEDDEVGDSTSPAPLDEMRLAAAIADSEPRLPELTDFIAWLAAGWNRYDNGVNDEQAIARKELAERAKAAQAIVVANQTATISNFNLLLKRIRRRFPNWNGSNADAVLLAIRMIDENQNHHQEVGFSMDRLVGFIESNFPDENIRNARAADPGAATTIAIRLLGDAKRLFAATTRNQETDRDDDRTRRSDA